LPFECNLQRYSEEEERKREARRSEVRSKIIDERRKIAVGLCTLESS
jgi:hypothetical protein